MIAFQPTTRRRMEYAKESLAVARAFMALPRNERDEFKRKIEVAALRWMAPARESDDDSEMVRGRG